MVHPRDRSDPREHVLIVGSGFAGLCMGIRLLQQGHFAFTILEQADRLGGTWRDNVYPGCACDVQSHLYSFSFAPNPAWTRMFPTQPEILDYMERCADRFGLRPHLRFGVTVTGASFDEAEGLWTVTTASGEALRARVLVAACGGLSVPAYPDVPGLERFAGTTFHSARWRHDVDLAGKRVAVIGTGASAIQFVPRIAPRVGRLSLFQRTPPWILPKPDRAITGGERRAFERAPWTQRLYRRWIYCYLETRVLPFTIHPGIMRLIQRTALRYLERSVADPALRARLTPDYTIGCKRVLISNDYYPALQRSNVELVTDAIERVTPRGVVTRDGRERAADVLILGTGFQASERLAPFPLAGRGGRDLAGSSPDGPEAFLGTVVSGFPNLFWLVGPNTGLGHSSMIYMIEAQVELAMRCLRAMKERRLRFMDVRPEQQTAFNQRLQARLARTVWASGCTSWYRTSSGKNTTLWPGFTWEFRLRAARAPLEAFELVG